MTNQDFKGWRTKWGLSQGKLAMALGVRSMTVARWEWGTIRIPALLPLALEALENRLRKEENMGLLMECPECKKRNSQKAKNCKCGFALAKFSGRVWWIEYYDHDKRLRRERIGPNKAAAEQR